MPPFDHEQLRTAALLFVIAVCGVDLGIAFVMRLTREASAEREDER